MKSSSPKNRTSEPGFSRIKLKEKYISIIKVIGIAYIVEFGKNVCIDAGQSSIATKLEMAGKVVIVVLTIPLISSLVNVLVGLV